MPISQNLSPYSWKYTEVYYVEPILVQPRNYLKFVLVVLSWYVFSAQAPIIVKSFKAKNLSLHEKLDISCKATGKQQATLFWYKDGKVIEESFDDRINLKHYHDLWTLQIRNVTVADSGTYRCEAMNRAGSSFSEAKVLVKGINVPQKYSTFEFILGRNILI